MQQGMTILELMLVLVIGAVFIFLGIQQYQTYRLDADLRQVKSNVGILSEAAARFYYANCIRQWNPDSGYVNSATVGVLDPSNTPAPSNPFTIGFFAFDATLGPYYSTNPVFTPFAPKNNFIVYFIRTDSDRTIPPSTKIGTIVQWRIRVAVRVPASKSVAYAKQLNADCTTDTPASLDVCQAGVTNKNYIIFERLPSDVLGTLSGYWLIMPQVAEFKQMYTTYPLLYLISKEGENQYFLCAS
ncbi:MAG: hypothetical protein A3F12_07290 [Gammaproteobacteria bacterium RIFCSPHIGHO2_12_FULL_38_14]|nr:MAG: hypothetical protein A3F12_07290 [Gammaproteobacteria bacterium RIFCSPHIGHO2_12_FULL_38_14]